MANVLSEVSGRRPQSFPAHGKDLADDQLLEQFLAQADDAAEQAFAELIRRHGPMVLGTCRQLLRDAHDADDAFQATFLVFVRKARSIRRPELLGAWLYGVAVRVARKAQTLNERRRRHETREAMMRDAEPVGDPGHPERGMVRREEVEVLHEELARLPEKYRLPVVLCDLEGLTHREAAGRLRWPTGSLSVRLMRARRLLHARLTRRGLAPTAALLVSATFAKTALATVPPDLATATVRAGLAGAGGGALASGVSSSVSSLTEKVLTSMTRAKLVAGGTIVAGGTMAVVIGLAALGFRDRGPANVGPAVLRNTVTERVSAAVVPRPPVSEPDLASGPSEGPSAVSENVAQPREQDEPAQPRADDVADVHASLVQRPGRDADTEVRLALRSEAKGLDAERRKHLALAILADPGHPAARGLLGQVAYEGRWRRADSVSEFVHTDTRLATARELYHAKRRKTPLTADGHWKLALWCEQQDLKPEATAHLVAVTRRDPDHDGAWKRLGRKKSNGRWLTEAQIAAERDQANAQKEGARHWKPLLAKWQGWLGEKARRDEAEAALARVTDPYAALPVWDVFGTGGPSDQRRAVQILGQIDAPAATEALGVLALLGPTVGVRKAACETLTRRDARVAIGLLVSRLRDPEPNPNSVVYRFQCLPVGALGIGSPGVSILETREANFVRFYTTDDAVNWSVLQATGVNPTPTTGYERRIANVHSRQIREMEQSVQSAVHEAARDVVPVVASVTEANAAIIQVLRNITGKDQGSDWAAWKRWWVEDVGYTYNPDLDRNPPDLTFFQAKPAIASTVAQPPVPRTTSCFAAGTPVTTLTGLRPIEAIQIGDQVLTQDAATGRLNFEPVVATFRNPPAPTVRIEFDRTTIVATGIHRFWKAGQGWVMARDLKAGDVVRTAGGVARVTAVSDGLIQPVFNLEVNAGQSFFAGPLGALVHDNSVVEPVRRPFDRADEID